MGRAIRRAAVSSNVNNNHDPGTDRQAGRQPRARHGRRRHSRMKKLHRRDATPVGLQKRAVEGAGDLSGSAATCPLPQKTCDTDKPCFRGDQTLRGPMLRESPCVAVVTGCQRSPTTASNSGRCFEGVTYPTTLCRPNQTPSRQCFETGSLAAILPSAGLSLQFQHRPNCSQSRGAISIHSQAQETHINPPRGNGDSPCSVNWSSGLCTDYGMQ